MDVTKALFQSYFWLIFGKWSVRLLGIISTLILVRILTPVDFGIAAQSMMVIMFFDAISHTGADQYVIKLNLPSNSQINTAWSINIALKSSAALFVLLFSNIIANYLGEPKLTDVLRVACLVSIFGSFISPKIILLKKNLNFKGISTLDIFVKIISFIVTISLAVTFKNYWALILGNVVSTIVLVMGSYVIAPFYPKFTFSQVKEQFHFSKNIFFMTVLGYLRSKIDILIVSQKFGSASTGYYSLAQEFSLLPYTEVVEPVSQPLYASLAKNGDNIALQTLQINKYLSIVYTLLVPAICGIILLADDIVAIVFGEQWHKTGPILANLSILMLVFSTNGAFKHIFTLSSRFKGAMLLDVFGIVLILLALGIDNIDSAELFSQYRVLVGVLIYILSLSIVKLLLKVDIRATLIAMIVPVISAAVMVGCLLILKSELLQLHNILANIIMMTFVGLIIYSGIWLFCIYYLRESHLIWAFDYALLKRGLVVITKKFNEITP